jgi:hypothetical protein
MLPVESNSTAPLDEGSPWSGRRVAALASLIALTALVLHAPRMAFPMILNDDFDFLRCSWTWADARGNLWRPMNEHVCPVARLTTRLLVELSGCAVALPYVLGLQGPLTVLACMGLVYLFLRRELGHPFYGLAGMAAFGVTSQYEEAVSWYCVTFLLFSLAFVLLALLAAQRWRQRRRLRSLVACAVWTALAPACFAAGILGGPLVCLYLLLPTSGDPPAPAVGWRRRYLPALAPLLGTALFLAVSLPRTAEVVLHAGHYGGKSALDAFHPNIGLVYSGRSLVDNLFLGSLGISGVVCPLVLVPFVLAGLLGAGVWWWKRAPRRHLLLLGLAFIFSSYFLIYAARSEWRYEVLVLWGRYQVYSHLGLVLFLAGGLPRWEHDLIAGSGRWAPTQGRFWLAALAVLWVVQTPRSLPYWYDPRQHAQLRQVDEVDASCRRYHIDAASARAALEPMPMAGGTEVDNAWALLRGSKAPQPLESVEVRRLLQP